MSHSSTQTNDQTPTFIYNGTEVVKTGRCAKRQWHGHRRNGQPIIDWLHEIKPVNEADGTWTAWVRLGELFEVVQ